MQAHSLTPPTNFSSSFYLHLFLVLSFSWLSPQPSPILHWSILLLLFSSSFLSNLPSTLHSFHIIFIFFPSSPLSHISSLSFLSLHCLFLTHFSGLLPFNSFSLPTLLFLFLPATPFHLFFPTYIAFPFSPSYSFSFLFPHFPFFHHFPSIAYIEIIHLILSLQFYITFLITFIPFFTSKPFSFQNSQLFTFLFQAGSPAPPPNSHALLPQVFITLINKQTKF